MEKARIKIFLKISRNKYEKYIFLALVTNKDDYFHTLTKYKSVIYV